MKSPSIRPMATIIFLQEGLVAVKKAPRVRPDTTPKVTSFTNPAMITNVKRGTKI
ncbi:hypothetical protein [Pyrococcus sp. ST04]|uniref:hypothetical protein n=1 Tax=Pyrococcus sp. ST04 TaxID=1183377 RepID=UPI000AEB80A4|nr:hypothetical protein [Pyrococcus sp. ST04]